MRFSIPIFSMNIKWLGVAVFFFFTWHTSAQIVGYNASCAGQVASYSIDNGVVYVTPNWVITNGTITNTSSSGTQYNVTVTWTAAGAGTLTFKNRTTVISTLNVTVGALPEDPLAQNTAICAKGTMMVTAGNNANSVRWYSVASGGSPLTTGTTSPYTVVTTTYYLSSYNTITGCESPYPRKQVTLTVIASPMEPSALPVSACGSATITGTSGVNGSTINWYTVPTGGTPTTSLTSPITTSTTTYYITSLNTTTGCETATRTAVTITIYPIPVISASGPTAFLYGNNNNVTLSTTSGLTSYRWIKDGVDISGATTNSYNTSNVASYKVATKVSASALECTSVTTPVTNILTGQPSPVNFVSTTRIYKKGVTTSTSLYSLTPTDLAQVVSYQDGLGHTFQTVAVGLSGNQTDLISPIGYGKQGLVDTTFLPYATASKQGNFRLNAIRINNSYTNSEQRLFYQNTFGVASDGKPYARTIRRAAPDARVIEQGAPGTDWQPGSGHTVRNLLAFNNATYPVRYWKADGTSTELYPANTVLAAITTDENGNKVRTFTNKQGQTILKQVQLDETINGTMVNWLDTYYIYDSYGRLVYQIPPKAISILTAAGTYDVNNSSVAELIYKYTYDNRGRITQKKVPGAAVEYIVYDKLNRVVLTQDGNQRAANQWAFVKYDVYQRPVYSGTYTNTIETTLAAVQGLVDAIPYTTQTQAYETRAVNATYQGYTNTAFPTSGTLVLAVNYYDDYDFDRNGTADYSYTTVAQVTTPVLQTNLRNLPTGSKKVVLGTTNWLYSVVFYDELDRPVQTRSNNHLNLTGVDLSTVKYFDNDLTTHVEKTVLTHSGPNALTVVQSYTYDHAWRTKGIFHSINGATPQQVVAYTYNDLGQLIDKKLHVDGSNFLQSIDLRYNIRGWLKTINNAQLAIDNVKNTNDDPNDYFGMELFYNDTTGSMGVGMNKYYNGNVASASIKSPGHLAGNKYQRNYKYSYDKSDKLLAATFQVNAGNNWSREANTLNESMTYDHNGNILTLVRNQNQRSVIGTNAVEQVDNLTYTYATNSNRLTKVEDAVAVGIGAGGDFKNGSTAATEYTYNSDGSLTQDLNKGISTITYNILGKPDVITYSGSPAKTVTYTYDAAGNKLKMVTVANSVTTTTDYVGGFVYTNNALSFFSSPEGRVVKNGSNYEYQYSIADHQGNTRVLFTSATAAVQTSTTDFEAAANASFQNYTSNRVDFELFDHTDVGISGTDYSQKLTGASNSQVGIAKSFRVYPGDKVKISAFAKYQGLSSTASNLSGFANQLATAFGVNGATTGDALKALNGLTGYGDLVTAGTAHSNQPSDPIAGVTILLFDKNYKLVNAAWKQINAASLQNGISPKANHEELISEYTVTEDGYAYVYVSNESPTLVDVYFDDVTMTYTPGNIIQYNEYYPFGLQTANSWTRENNTGNNYLFNGGTELNTTTGVMDLFYRNYDPSLGRMNQVDPMASKYASITPYNYSMNSPVVLNDPMGDDVQVRIDFALYQFIMSKFRASEYKGGGRRTAGGSGTPIIDSGTFGGRSYTSTESTSWETVWIPKGDGTSFRQTRQVTSITTIFEGYSSNSEVSDTGTNNNEWQSLKEDQMGGCPPGMQCDYDIKGNITRVRPSDGSDQDPSGAAGLELMKNAGEGGLMVLTSEVGGIFVGRALAWGLGRLFATARVARITVLGSYPLYLERAAELGANKFSIPSKTWNSMTAAEQWAANVNFLDQAIMRGDQIILSNSAFGAKEGTFFYKEIQYLLSKGYKISEDGMSLIAP